MQSYRKIFSFLMLFTFHLLYGYDVNSTLVDANTTTYMKLLTNINQEKSKSTTKILEKSLLHILISNPKKVFNKRDLVVTEPKDTHTYKIAFQHYLNIISQIDKTQILLKQTQEKIITIEKEILKIDKKSLAFPLELQDALYHKNVSLFKEQIYTYKKVAKNIKNILINRLKTIHIDTQLVKKELEKEKLLQQEIMTKINTLQINKEQAQLLMDTNKSLYLSNSIRKLEFKQQINLQNIISSQFLLFASSLHQKQKNSIALAKKLLKETQRLDNFSSIDTKELSYVIHAMETKYLGSFQTLTTTGEEDITTLSKGVWTLLSNPIFHINQTPISILKLILTLFIFIMGFILGSLYKRKIKSMSLNKRSFTSSTRTLLANIGYYFIILVAFFFALNALGIKLSSLAIVAGALSVGIGFGLQNIVSNFVSGLILMIERSIKIGDYIQLDDNLRGRVSDIRMRSTTVVTNDNIDVIIPNQKLIENNVINWTMSDSIRRYSIPFDVAYGTDVHKVIELVTQTILQSEYKENIVNNSQHETKVIMTAMADSSLNFELLIWTKGEYSHRPKRAASIFLILIYDVLNENNIEIPFPQQDLHIRSIEKVLA
ncbi:mechanosensitive ion channel family protein [Sulfurimonas sp.]